MSWVSKSEMISLLQDFSELNFIHVHWDSTIWGSKSHYHILVVELLLTC